MKQEQRKRIMRRITLLATAVIAALALTSCSESFNANIAMQGGAKLLQAATLSNAQVQSYTRQYINDLDKKSDVLPDSNPYSIRLRKLTGGLTSVEGIPLNFKVYKTDEVNAFACADGSVRVYTGLMDLMTDDEVLGVIGHEIGHVGLKHTRKQFQQALMTSALRYGLASAGGTVGELSASQIGALGEALASSSYSRTQEAESDDYGYNFLVKNGKNPWSMAMAFEKLQSLSGNATTNRASKNLFSSHPDTASRIKRMSERATKDGFKRPVTKKSK